MKKINKLAITSVGALVTTSLLGVVISCSEKLSPQQSVDAVDVEVMKKEIDKLFQGYKDKTATLANKAVDQRFVGTIYGALIDFKTKVNENNSSIEFEATKVYNGDAVRKEIDLRELKGAITGFRNKQELDQEFLDNLIANDVNKEIDNLFPDYEKWKAASKAKESVIGVAPINQKTIIVKNDSGKGTEIKFEAIADDINKVINYTILNIVKDKATITDLSKFHGAIVGFSEMINPSVVDGKFPIIKGQSGVGVLNRADAQVDNVTTTFKYKNDQNDIWDSFSIDNDFKKGNWLQVTWTANPGFAFSNGKKSIVEERELDYLLTQEDEINRDAIIDFMKTITKEAVKNKVDILFALDKASLPSVALTDMKERVVTLSPGFNIGFKPTADDFNGEITYVITHISKGNHTEAVPNKNATLNVQLIALNNKIGGFAKSKGVALPTLKDNFPVIEGVSGSGVLTKTDANITGTEVSFKWKATENDSWATFDNASDFANDNWLQVTWTTIPGFIFNDGTTSVTLEKKIVLNTQDAQDALDIEAFITIKDVSGNLSAKTIIKDGIERLFAKYMSLTPSEANSNVKNREIFLSQAIKVSFTTRPDDVNKKIIYTIDKISKGNKEVVADARFALFGDEIINFK